ncbi:COX15/CtaA family protein [Cellvibrio fontiphilus]|uniref:Heme A synthase n=1 Tax=Cellvibrio fontiphilus TaxID=1815559 RepID=A0ABV7FHL6_9GAMM
MKIFSALVNFTLVLTLAVIALGAYTRLTDAGLGCPDWPGCYGKFHAPVLDHHIADAQEKYPHLEVDPYKARNEMLHRYIAGVLGLAVLAIFIASHWLKRYRILASSLLLLVIFQAALGMWTVTLNLLPLIVLAHLLGGFTLLCLLALLRAEISWEAQSSSAVAAKTLAEPALAKWIGFGVVSLLVVIAQIALGGWTSTNYAAAVCNQLPFCEPGWQERFSFAQVFHLPLGHETYEYGVLPYEARMSIHVLHRIGAIVTLLVLGSFLCVCWRNAQTRVMQRLVLAMGFLLLLQITLGLINIVALVPLWNAVAHNLVAANLLMLLLVFLRQMVLRNPEKVYGHNQKYIAEC